jgi:hypothetical protein
MRGHFASAGAAPTPRFASADAHPTTSSMARLQQRTRARLRRGLHDFIDGATSAAHARTAERGLHDFIDGATSAAHARTTERGLHDFIDGATSAAHAHG